MEADKILILYFWPENKPLVYELPSFLPNMPAIIL